jgi:hypothetical protein
MDTSLVHAETMSSGRREQPDSNRFAVKNGLYGVPHSEEPLVFDRLARREYLLIFLQHPLADCSSNNSESMPPGTRLADFPKKPFAASLMSRERPDAARYGHGVTVNK